MPTIARQWLFMQCWWHWDSNCPPSPRSSSFQRWSKPLRLDTHRTERCATPAILPGYFADDGQPAAPPFATVHHCERLLDNFPTCMRNRSGTMLRVHPWEPSWIHRGLLLLRGVVPMGASCWKPSRVCPSRSTRSSNTTRWGSDLGATGKRIHEASKRWDRPSS